MSDEKDKRLPDPLVRNRIFPEASSVFTFAPVSLDEALRDGLIAVDTNVLLLPYTTSSDSLAQIRKTYERLTVESRLRIPAQVAREFADNRAEKLKLVYQQLSRKRDFSFNSGQYPLLETLAEYSALKELESEISEKLRLYRKSISNILGTIEEWQWNDPVSEIYRLFFNSDNVVDPNLNRDSLLCELKFRQEHKVPPGYKDANNPYSGIGDIIIWKTLLDIGQRESRHMVFVSGDEKSDWRYQSEEKALYPRYELSDEYRRNSNGKSLHIISFAELLKRFGVSASVVAEIRQEEIAVALESQRESTEQGDWDSVDPAVSDWIHLRHSRSIVSMNLDRFPDFMVEGVRGYEIKKIGLPQNVFRILRQVTPSIQKYFFTTKMPLTLVLIVDNPLAADYTGMLLSGEMVREQLGYFDGELKVEMGTIQDNRFLKLTELSISG